MTQPTGSLGAFGRYAGPATLPKSATVIMSAGCHTGPFFTQQEPPSLAFLARHLS